MSQKNEGVFQHEVKYYTLRDTVIGFIPSLDKAFIVKEGVYRLPSHIVSTELPLFHESYKHKIRIKRVLVLTDACNLQCEYCFEGKHSAHQMMSKYQAQRIIEEMFREAKACDKKLISFSLFGGEPTINWETLVCAVKTAERLENATGIRCYKAVVTNGVMRSEQADFLAGHLDFIYFSLDGPKNLFLQQRKPNNGEGAYNMILENARRIYHSSAYLSFKVTVTHKTVNYLKEIDDFFAVNFPTCGRLYQPCMVDKSDELYISFGCFLEAYLELKRYSLFSKTMTTPLFKNQPSDRFCNLMIRNVIYPDGTVLACHRSNMCIPDDEVRKKFYVGRCEDGIVHREPFQQYELDQFLVKNIIDCQNCPMKYHCCGGCATVKLLSGNHDMFRKADYCEDFLKFSFTLILSRLFESNLAYISAIPKHLDVQDFKMDQDKFMHDVVQKCISIEE